VKKEMVTASLFFHSQARIAAVKIGKEATLLGYICPLWAQSPGCLGWTLCNVQGSVKGMPNRQLEEYPRHLFCLNHTSR
jgi:hypothetical protein